VERLADVDHARQPDGGAPGGATRTILDRRPFRVGRNGDPAGNGGCSMTSPAA